MGRHEYPQSPCHQTCHHRVANVTREAHIGMGKISHAYGGLTVQRHPQSSHSRFLKDYLYFIIIFLQGSHLIISKPKPLKTDFTHNQPVLQSTKKTLSYNCASVFYMRQLVSAD